MTDKMIKDDFLSLFNSKYLRVNDGGKEKRRIISDYSKKLMTNDGCRILNKKLELSFFSVAIMNDK